MVIFSLRYRPLRDWEGLVGLFGGAMFGLLMALLGGQGALTTARLGKRLSGGIRGLGRLSQAYRWPLKGAQQFIAGDFPPRSYGFEGVPHEPKRIKPINKHKIENKK